MTLERVDKAINQWSPQARGSHLKSLSIRFQLVHKTVSGGEGVNASVTRPKQHRKIHSHGLAFDKHPSIYMFS